MKYALLSFFFTQLAFAFSSSASNLINSPACHRGPSATVYFTSPLSTLSVKNTNNITVTVGVSAAQPCDFRVYLQKYGTAVEGTDISVLPKYVTMLKNTTSVSFTYNALNSATAGDLFFNLHLTEAGLRQVALGANTQAQHYIEDNTSPLYQGSENYLSISTSGDDTIGQGSTCGVTFRGQLKCWGYNSTGQLGDGSTVNRPSPTDIDFGQIYSQVSMGETHTCAVSHIGVLKCWGNNSTGQLGNNSTTQSNSPVTIDVANSYSSVSAGGEHTCAITQSGALYCWGKNSDGQIGDTTTTQRNVPTLIDSGVSYLSVSAGKSHTCGVTSANVLKCWGQNTDSQLGDGTTTPQSTPTVIDSGVNYDMVSVGNFHSCGILSSGALKCWGKNNNGQVGNSTTSTVTSPTVIDSGVNYNKISAGTSHTCALTTSNIYKCWGLNSRGQVGDGTTTQRTSPVVIDSGVYYYTLSDGGGLHSCAVVESNKTLKCQGANNFGQIGNANTSDQTSPVVADNLAPGFVRMVASAQQICIIRTDQKLKCWGENYHGALGSGDQINKSKATDIDSSTTYLFISAGTFSTCGIDTDFKLRCWGGNNYGALGDGTTTQRLNPVIVDETSDYKKVSVGSGYACAITLAGVLKCWGANFSGQLGDNSTTQRNSPVVINAGTKYADIRSSSSSNGEVTGSTCAITQTGQAQCWGLNSNGQLGDNTTVDKLVPTNIDVGVKYIAITTSKGWSYSCGITQTNKLRCWGNNSGNQLGDWGASQYLVPTNADNANNYANFTAPCGVLINKQLRCFVSGGPDGYGVGWNALYSSDSAYSYLEFTTSDEGTYSTKCARTTDGHVRCYGWSAAGQRQDGSQMIQSPIIATPSEKATFVANGVYGDQCIVTTAGQIKCRIGPGKSQKHGTGGTEYPRYAWIPVKSNATFSKVLVSDTASCALNTAGELLCWGNNHLGVFADGGVMGSSNKPILTDFGTRYKDLSGTTSQYNMSFCGVSIAGQLRCWGENSSYQLGDGTNTSPRLSPVVIDSGTTYSKVAFGDSYGCAITTSGDLKCWGNNANNRLGDGTTTTRSTPVVIDPGVRYMHISLSNSSCGITSSNQLKCWGNNPYGLGNGTNSSTTPTVIDSGVAYKFVFHGSSRVCAITVTNKLRCWGMGSWGGVGDGTGNSRSTPVDVDPAEDYLYVDTSWDPIAITTSGDIKGWGNATSLGMVLNQSIWMQNLRHP